MFGGIKKILKVREIHRLRKRLKKCKNRDEMINAFAEFYEIPEAERPAMREKLIAQLHAMGLGGEKIKIAKFKKFASKEAGKNG